MDDNERVLQRARERIYYSRLPEDTRNTHRFNTFQITPDNREAFEEATYFCFLNPDLTPKFTEDHKHTIEYNGADSILFAGPAGRGKTHLALSIAWHTLLESGEYVLYWQVEDLLDTLRLSYSKSDGEWAKILEKCKKVTLLVLDDLGTQKDTEWARAKLDLIIDYRYIHEYPIVVTTNAKPEQLGERISSRLSEGIICILAGDDYRILKARRREYERRNGK
jgi:DNA replication protein DnaC